MADPDVPVANEHSDFVRLGPSPPQQPVAVAIPHAGRHYPAWLLDDARVDTATLRRLEDRYVDLVAGGLARHGFSVIQALQSRALIDLNRGEQEWDSQLVDGAPPPLGVPARVRAGLGLVPTRLHGVGQLWRRRITPGELARRIERYHRPYHAAIAAVLAAARARFGRAVLIDLHSMPQQTGGTPHIVIGDRHGTTASLQLVDRLMALAQGQGLVVTRNEPYAGAHSIMRHADIAGGIEAVQIEFDRTLYLDRNGSPEPERLLAMQRLFAAMVSHAADHARAAAAPLADAAE